MSTRFLTVFVLLMGLPNCSTAFGQNNQNSAGRVTHNVVLVTVDGLHDHTRWP